MRENEQMIADLHGIELYVFVSVVENTVSEGGHALSQCAEGGGCAADGVTFEDASTDEHHDNDQRDDVLAGEDSGEDGDSGDEINCPVASN